MVLLLIAAIIVPSSLGARPQGEFTVCKSNVRNMSTACEMYVVDNGGEYPDNLDFLCQGNKPYMNNLPTCPAKGIYVYTKNKYSENKTGFKIYCSGKRHKYVIGDNDGPAFGSQSGLVDLKDEAR